MKTNALLMKEARETLAGNWALAIVAYVIYTLIVSAGNFVPGGSLIIAGPMALGLSIFLLALSRTKKADFSQLFEGFKYFVPALIAYLLMTIFIILWSLLLIIPGIIAAISYSQVFYIIADDPKIEPMDALRKSQEMMKGRKWKYFCLGLRFFGWFILSILTLGIGFLLLFPYMQMTFTKFYEDIK